MLEPWLVLPFFMHVLHNIFADYLCPPEANVYNIDFTRFKLRDMETGTVLFEVAKPESQVQGKYILSNLIVSCLCQCVISGCSLMSANRLLYRSFMEN